ncbi:hypothetical protein JCM11251_001896 [Rhodosporidiobolus azoricus]
MARFGLSDSESDQSDHESASTARRSRSRSTSAPPSHQDGSFTSSHPGSEEGSDGDEEDAPPRDSLMEDDQDEDENENEDEDASFDDSQLDGEDDQAMDDTFFDHARPTSKARTTRSVSTFSRASRSRSQSAFSRDDSRTPSPPPTARRGLLPPSARQQQQQQQNKPWAQQLKLDPSRVAVMQASFFGQGNGAAVDGFEEEEEDEREDEGAEQLERENKRRAVESGLGFAGAKSNSTAAPPSPTAPAPIPTPLLPAPLARPFRPFVSTPLASSLMTSLGSDGSASIVDEGLALGRSFRIGWGPGGEVVSLQGGKSGAVKVDKMKLVEPSSKTESSLRLLRLHLSHTSIDPPSNISPSPSSPSSFSAPAAVPSSEMRFGHFVELFQSMSKDQNDGQRDEAQEAEQQLFKLASLLFDEIPDLSPPSPSSEEDPETTTPLYASHLSSLRRRDALSSWLESVTSSSAARTLSTLPPASSSSPSSAAKRIFAHLTAHQISQAVHVALESGNLRLATLLSQLAPSGSGAATDPQFKEDVFLQLAKWREYGVEVDPALRRVWEVLAGNLGRSEGAGEGEAFEVLDKEAQGLRVGWKEALGMGLWYGLRSDGAEDELADAVARYEAALAASPSVARPLPAYLNDEADSRNPATRDPAFHLLKLVTDSTYPLSSLLMPTNYGPSRTNYRLPWTLYVLLSRVLRRRDFEDREELGQEEMGEGEGEVEGNSVTADRLTESYAAQLESQGEWGWAGFVLLFLELEGQRTAALRALLARHALSLGENAPQEEKDKVRFLVDECKVPEVWVWSARADYLLSLSPSSTLSTSRSPLFESYTLLLRALRPSLAHRIAVEHLVPEAIIRGDSGLVRRLVEPFVVDEEQEGGGEGLRGNVEGWEEGGQVYLLYLLALSSSSPLPNLPLLSRALTAVQSLSARAASSPRTKGNLKLKLATAEMLSRLNVLAKAGAAGARGSSSTSSSLLDKLQPSLLPPSDRSVWIQGAGRAFWEGSLARAGAGVKA